MSTGLDVNYTLYIDDATSDTCHERQNVPPSTYIQGTSGQLVYYAHEVSLVLFSCAEVESCPRVHSGFLYIPGS